MFTGHVFKSRLLMQSSWIVIFCVVGSSNVMSDAHCGNLRSAPECAFEGRQVGLFLVYSLYEKIAIIGRETMGFAIIGLQSSTSLK